MRSVRKGGGPPHAQGRFIALMGTLARSGNRGLLGLGDPQSVRFPGAASTT